MEMHCSEISPVEIVMVKIKIFRAESTWRFKNALASIDNNLTKLWNFSIDVFILIHLVKQTKNLPIIMGSWRQCQQVCVLILTRCLNCWAITIKEVVYFEQNTAWKFCDAQNMSYLSDGFDLYQPLVHFRILKIDSVIWICQMNLSCRSMCVWRHMKVVQILFVAQITEAIWNFRIWSVIKQKKKENV